MSACLIETLPKGEVVLYADEVDIDLNPKIGPDYMLRGTQKMVVTPGKNQKHYLAGALHAGTGRLVWVEHFHKNTRLFLKLLNAIRAAYRRARRIVLVLDNYKIHKARAVERWLAQNPKFEFVFQPVYYPWVNRIERLWKTVSCIVFQRRSIWFTHGE